MAILKGLVIASAGDIKNSAGQSISNEQLKKWIVNNKGLWATEVGKGTTHLISSKDAYKRDSKAVRKATELQIYIVSYDWLEDSLQKGRKVAERKYIWKAKQAQRRIKKELKRLAPHGDAKKFNAGCELAEQDIGSGTSHKRPSGFFASALQDLKRKREAREAKEAEEQANQAQVGKPSRPPEPATCVATESPIPPTPCSKTRCASEPTIVAPKSPVEQQRFSERMGCIEEVHDASSQSSTKSTTENTPTPSPFPPSIKYTPPSSSSGPYIPRSFKTSTPSPATVVQHVEMKPANPKLEDLYHIYLDNKGFEYKLILLRSNLYLNNFARYDLRLYESHTIPHVYCTVARYIPPAGAKPAAPIPAAQNSDQSMAHMRSTIPSAETATPQAQLGEPQDPVAHPVAAHLQSLITPPSPSPAAHYRAAIAPPNSDFQTAFRAFRHAFRDLTLLSWHERLNPDLQRLRAQAFCIEPFVWRRPAEGLPTGLQSLFPLGETDVQLEGYRRNAFELPALDEPLGREGSVGSALFREAEAVRRNEEERRRADDRRQLHEKLRAKKSAPAAQYYVPQQTRGLFSGKPAGASTTGPAGPVQRSGRAIIMDYRTAKQRMHERR